jgi:hypothetical protein
MRVQARQWSERFDRLECTVQGEIPGHVPVGLVGSALWRRYPSTTMLNTDTSKMEFGFCKWYAPELTGSVQGVYLHVQPRAYICMHPKCPRCPGCWLLVGRRLPYNHHPSKASSNTRGLLIALSGDSLIQLRSQDKRQGRGIEYGFHAKGQLGGSRL